MTSMIDHVREGCTCGGKRCPDCKQIKCHAAFNHNRSTTDGLYVYCRACQRMKNTAYYSQHRTPSQAERAIRENVAVEHVATDCMCGGKWCPGCEQVKCHGTFNRSNRRDGFQTYCRMCHSAHMRAYRKAHPDRMREMARAYTQTHREACRAMYKRYRDAHPERVKQATKRWRSKNTDFYKEQDRKRAKARYSAYPEYVKAYREAKREWYREYNKCYRKKNLQYFLIQCSIRRTRETQVGGSYTVQAWNDLCASYNYRCLCCGKQEPEIKLTADHIIPVSKHGSSNIDNIQPLCKSCNSKKRDKIIDYRARSTE